ncbi:hypothetical protein B0I35DRAFT_421500 [Stachybotrys elegans]|uniref:Uncharacterized protein n=1 Tax=Stachybotrys elegans TaxID=80388 RepID=A0A8K0SZ63_9HYPO|nr:hypothetical protein B0I35DRAFT_421500 [Stachybotrys elegans]
MATLLYPGKNYTGPGHACQWAFKYFHASCSCSSVPWRASSFYSNFIKALLCRLLLARVCFGSEDAPQQTRHSNSIKHPVRRALTLVHVLFWIFPILGCLLLCPAFHFTPTWCLSRYSIAVITSSIQVHNAHLVAHHWEQAGFPSHWQPTHQLPVHLVLPRYRHALLAPRIRSDPHHAMSKTNSHRRGTSRYLTFVCDNTSTRREGTASHSVSPSMKLQGVCP